MHPYLFFYLLGGVTFIPLTLTVTVLVLWIRLPTLDPSLPRPTDLPSAASLTPSAASLSSSASPPSSSSSSSSGSIGTSVEDDLLDVIDDGDKDREKEKDRDKDLPTGASTATASDNHGRLQWRKPKTRSDQSQALSAAKPSPSLSSSLPTSLSSSSGSSPVSVTSAPSRIRKQDSPSSGTTEVDSSDDDQHDQQHGSESDDSTEPNNRLRSQDNEEDYHGDHIDNDSDERPDRQGFKDATPRGSKNTSTPTAQQSTKRNPEVLVQSDPRLNKERFVRMTRVPRLGPAAESISDYMTNMLFQPKNTRPKDSYYAVLRYDTLFLYESDQQRECKAVVPMKLYEVRIFPKNLPDNEVFNKEHPIQIKRIPAAVSSAGVIDSGQDEYYIFIPSPVIKEDWYLALLHASKLQKPGTKKLARDKAQFEPEAIENHIRILHSDKHHEHTRWFNSFLGRIFLGVYRTKRVQEIFIQKITRKTLKLKRPSFLGEIKVKSFHIGHSIPYITRTRLIELARNGELTSEFYLSYRGGVRVEIEVDVGLGLATLKPMKVTIVLAVLVKSISGMMTLRIKAPPTNRFWIGFQEPPEMDIVIEPIVADKAIKLNMVLSAIESKIREAMAEAIVLPNMDDYPFFDSHGTGGIFEGDEEVSSDSVDESDAESAKAGQLPGSIGVNSGSGGGGGGGGGGAYLSGGSVAKTGNNGRRGSDSSVMSDVTSAPPHIDSSDGRKHSWSSNSTDSDVDSEPSGPPSRTTASGTPPPVNSNPGAIYLNPGHNSSSTSTSTSSALASSVAAKLKRFSQVHFSNRSSDSVGSPGIDGVTAAKLNTKPTVATSIATAIRTSPSSMGTLHYSNNGSGSGTGGGTSKLQSVLPRLILNNGSDPYGTRVLSSSSSSNGISTSGQGDTFKGPSKKDSISSLRRLASLETPTSEDSESGQDGSDDAIISPGDDPLYQSLTDDRKEGQDVERAKKDSQRGHVDSETLSKTKLGRKRLESGGEVHESGKDSTGTGGGVATEDKGATGTKLGSGSSPHAGIKGILEDTRLRRPRSNSSASNSGLTMAFGNHHPAGIFTAAGSNRRPQQSQETSEDNLDSVDASKGLTPPAVNQEHGRKNSFDRLASLKLKKDMLLKRSSSLIGSGRNAIANAGLHPPLLSRRMTEDRRMSEDDPLLAGMKMND